MINPLTYDSWLKQASASLEHITETPSLEARMLLSHILNVSATALITWPERQIEPSVVSELSQSLKRRQNGEPIQYIIGSTEFWGRTIAVNPDVLIPRPETETLVELAMAKNTEQAIDAPQILDLGTGSGAIAIALASELPEAMLTAVDISESALQVARANADRNRIENINFYQSDWFSAVNETEQFEIIVANPPYIAEDDPHLEQLTHEPMTALTADNNGLADIEHLIMRSTGYLKPDGWLIIEHGYQQGADLRRLFKEHSYRRISTTTDLAGHERITAAQRPE